MDEDEDNVELNLAAAADLDSVASFHAPTEIDPNNVKTFTTSMSTLDSTPKATPTGYSKKKVTTRYTE
jgi:hypothetical protein